MALSKQQRIAIARAAAARHGLDPDVFVRQIQQESGFQVRIGSPAGAQGIAQIMPATARAWGVDPNDPVAALNAAAQHMAGYVHSYKGDYAKALAAYNAGPGAVAKYGGVPPFKETQHYVSTILAGRNPVHGRPTPAGMAGDAAGATGAADPGTLAHTARQQAAMQMAFRGNPALQQVAAAIEAKRAATPTPSLVGQDVQPSSTQIARGAIGHDYRWLQHEAQTRFGLRNDPGNSQTYGGHHTHGSEHYKKRALDEGTALNTPAQLAAWAAWAKAQGLDVLNEGDHIHVSLPGGGI